MKKALYLILALVMCLSLCACGSNTENANTEATAPVIYKIGDTVTTKMFNCTLTSANFANEACNWMNGTYLLPCDEHYHQKNLYVADEGYQLLCFTFELTCC